MTNTAATAIKKVNLDELNFILSSLSENQQIVVYSQNKSHGLNKRRNDKMRGGDGKIITNPNHEAITKRNLAYGKVNFKYEQEMREKLNDPNFTVTKPKGIKVGALQIQPTGVVLPLMDVEYGKPEYYLNGQLMTDEQVKEMVYPYKPERKEKEEEVRVYTAPSVKGIISILIGNTEYHITNPDGTITLED